LPLVFVCLKENEGGVTRKLVGCTGGGEDVSGTPFDKYSTCLYVREERKRRGKPLRDRSGIWLGRSCGGSSRTPGRPGKCGLPLQHILIHAVKIKHDIEGRFPRLDHPWLRSAAARIIIGFCGDPPGCTRRGASVGIRDDELGSEGKRLI